MSNELLVGSDGAMVMNLESIGLGVDGVGYDEPEPGEPRLSSGPWLLLVSHQLQRGSDSSVLPLFLLVVSRSCVQDFRPLTQPRRALRYCGCIPPMLCRSKDRLGLMV